MPHPVTFPVSSTLLETAGASWTITLKISGEGGQRCRKFEYKTGH